MTIKSGSFKNCPKLDWLYAKKGFGKVEKNAFKKTGTKTLAVYVPKKKKTQAKKMLKKSGLKHYKLVS